eukprot:TRINITY_DN900_c0_g1_i2.p1 TRINITY_DN900_c0_g1~~TRINITY_DN900_c0_g1_i2.p1  ORF type:complete len:454 (+),score=83.40 TRINITY_DN900_c0_g1_i2:101-1462(+)
MFTRAIVRPLITQYNVPVTSRFDRVHKIPTLQKRSLSLHEYQGLGLLRESGQGLNVVKGSSAATADEALKIAETYFEFFGPEIDLMVKAQILAGGRGKGHFNNGLQSGIHICSTPQEVRDVAEKMIGNNLITAQTGPNGIPVSKVLVCERKYIRRESYFSITMDRESGGPVILGSAEGGVNIEILAHKSPEKIIREVIDPVVGITPEQALDVAIRLGFKGKQSKPAAKQIEGLYNIFWNNDCTLVEINPLAELADGHVVCMDAKILIDDNALFRHPNLAAMHDNSQEDPRDVLASEHDLNYIGLDGNIACLVNGAGLAMATMDIISLHGGTPANFLDVGGGASEKQVMEAFKIITSDPNVRSILVNIFGGIMRCDVIAMGIISAAQSIGLHIPVVMRLQGTNVQKAKEIIEASGLRLIATDELDQAAEHAVKIARIMEVAHDAKLKVSFQLPI